MATPHSQFYVVGGTVNPDSPSYVVRKADQELYDRLLAGEFCYVLTSRQMGKSSLMARTARRLTTEAKIHAAIVDLTQIGTERDKLSAEQWYYGIAHRILREVGLRDMNLSEWWQSRSQLPALQRLTEFFRDLLLEQIAGPIVIFIDEIDSTISLPFTDDFFAAIRACHNARATDAAYNRLSFVLLGVASPSDLVKDATRTPFNVGQRIELTDFTAEEATPLAAGLRVNGQDGEQILARILDWTGGHPYLTQKLCQIWGQTRTGCPSEQIDQLVEETFPVVDGPPEDSNLRFVYDRVAKSPQHRNDLVKLYRQILKGRDVYDDPNSIIQTKLKLSGIVKLFPDGKLRVRNRIYKRVFNETWVENAHESAKKVKPTQIEKKTFIQTTIKFALYNGVTFGFLLFLSFLGHSFQIRPGGKVGGFNGIEWATEQIRSAIYWVMHDALWIVLWVFHWWTAINNPIIALGILLLSITIASLFQSLLKKRIKQNRIARFAIPCPICMATAPPVPGTENHYRCKNGHVFSSAYHGW